MNAKHVQIGDAQLHADVVEEIVFASNIDAAHVGVSVHDGAVILTGEVGSLPERMAARSAALRVRGVRAVADDLVVRTPVAPGGEDIDIARAAAHHLDWAVDVPPDAVQAEVRNHRLTLTGTVRWDHQRRAAAQAVSQIRGLTYVDNHIALDQPVSVSGTKNAIEAAIARNAHLDAGRITVEVSGHDLTLRGDVRSWAERNQADDAAWHSPGVITVNNELHVNPYIDS